MAILDLFNRKGTVAGTVVIHGLPAHETYSVSVTFFRVSAATSPAPDDDLQAKRDTETVKAEAEPDDKPLNFRFQKPSGFYYISVGVIVYFRRDGKMFAQVERFYPMPRPCQLQAGGEQEVELAVTWPDIPFDELHYYGTVDPSN